VNTEVIERFPTATLYQDTIGTIPVTTPGQAVALMLDKSRGLTLGTELLPDSFSSGTWTSFAAGVSVSSGVVAFSNVAPGSNGLLLSGLNGSPYTTGKAYSVTLTVTGYVSGGIRVWTGSGYSTTFTANGTYTFWAVYPADTSLRVYAPASGSNTTLSATISVKELPGNHATQATAASRPIYGVVPQGGRRNLLTYSEQFDNAAWTKTGITVSVTSATDPLGGSTADRLAEAAAGAANRRVTYLSTTLPAQNHAFSFYAKADGLSFIRFNEATTGVGRVTYFDVSTGAVGTKNASHTATIESVGSGWYRCVVSFLAGTTADTPLIGISNADNVNSYTGTGADGIFIWGAQLETGSTATPYQKVTTLYDVTEAGVPSCSYLAFDGVDDFMVTPTITPGIDKAQVFAGVRKLSDAAAGAVAELSINYGLSDGSFILLAPEAGTPSYRFGSSGSVRVINAAASGFAAPITNVLTGLGDISGDLATLRANGTQAAQNTADQGTGNYLAYPIYIGRRAGTTLPFNGQLYSLVVRFGANLDATVISSTETFVAGKTGVTL
jgi:hypothetical protein